MVASIEQTRSAYLRHVFKLPRGTPSGLFFVLFPCLLPEILCSQRRLNFYRRSLRHDLLCVPAGLVFNLTVMYKRTCGWVYESFLFLRSVRPETSFSNFDFVQDVERLVTPTDDERLFSFHYIKNSTSTCVSFFRLFPTVKTSDSFRRVIGSIEQSH